MNRQRNVLAVISGPSGVGKGTVIKEMFRLRPSLKESVSCTTRAPRAGDAPGGTNFIVRQEQADQAFCRTAKFLRCQGNDCLTLKRALP